MTPYLSYVTASDEEYLRLVNQTPFAVQRLCTRRSD